MRAIVLPSSENAGVFRRQCTPYVRARDQRCDRLAIGPAHAGFGRVTLSSRRSGHGPCFVLIAHAARARHALNLLDEREALNAYYRNAFAPSMVGSLRHRRRHSSRPIYEERLNTIYMRDRLYCTECCGKSLPLPHGGLVRHRLRGWCGSRYAQT
jgi:hypothetical protein